MILLGTLNSDLTGLGQKAMHDPLPFAIAISIGLFSLVVWWFGFRRRFAPAIRAVAKGARIVRETASADSFVERYEELNQRLLREPVIGLAWRGFAEMLLLPALPGQRVRTSVRPAVYFNESLLPAAGLNLRFYQAFPNYVVGVGLLFTFLALTIALGAAAGSLGSDQKEMASHLQTLLDTAAFKFVTSLAGLGCSIIFSWRLRDCLHGFHGRLGYFCALLDERLDFVTPERIADEQLAELRRQSEALERFNTDFAVSVAQALDERMNANVPQWIAPITSALGGLTEQMGTMNQDALGQMVSDFSQKLQGSTQEQMAQLAAGLSEIRSALTTVTERVGQSGEIFGARMETAGAKFSENMQASTQEQMAQLATGLDEMRGALNAVTERIGQSGESFGERVDSAGAKFSGNIETVSRTMEGMLKVNTATMRVAIEPLAERAEQFGNTIKDLDERIGRQLSAFQDNLQALGDVHAGITAAAQQIERSAEPLAATLATMQVASLRLEQAGTAMTQTQERLGQFSADLAAAAQSVEKAWETHRARFEKVDADLERSFETLLSGMEGYREQVEKFSVELVENLTLASRHLVGGVEELRDAFDEFSEALQKRDGQP